MNEYRIKFWDGVNQHETVVKEVSLIAACIEVTNKMSVKYGRMVNIWSAKVVRHKKH